MSTPRYLSTIQKREKLNDVQAVDDRGPGNANHVYHISRSLGDSVNLDILSVKFQKGPRNDPDSISGVMDTDLLEIVRDRLIGFQSGPYSCRENAVALTKIEEALMWLNRRVEDRIERNVLGSYDK